MTIKILKGDADKKTFIKILKIALKEAKKLKDDDEITCAIIQHNSIHDGYQCDFHVNRDVKSESDDNEVKE